MEGNVYSKKTWMLVSILFLPFIGLMITAPTLIAYSIIFGVDLSEAPLALCVFISLLLAIPFSYYIYKAKYRYAILITKIIEENPLSDNPIISFEREVDSLLSSYNISKKVKEHSDWRDTTYSFMNSTLTVNLANSLGRKSDSSVIISLKIKSPDDEELMYNIKK